MKVSMLEGAPLYEQMQEDGQGCILSREDAHWVVRAAAGQGDALLRAPYENTPSVPSSGWAFLDSELQVWAEDATMTAAPWRRWATPRVPTHPCLASGAPAGRSSSRRRAA